MLRDAASERHAVATVVLPSFVGRARARSKPRRAVGVENTMLKVTVPRTSCQKLDAAPSNVLQLSGVQGAIALLDVTVHDFVPYIRKPFHNVNTWNQAHDSNHRYERCSRGRET